MPNVCDLCNQKSLRGGGAILGNTDKLLGADLSIREVIE